jgi:hypothetical protein
MSAQNILNQLSPEGVVQVNSLMDEGKYEDVRVLLGKFSKPDVTALIMEHVAKVKPINPTGSPGGPTPGFSTPTAPAGAADIESMLGGSSFENVIKASTTGGGAEEPKPKATVAVTDAEMHAMWGELNDFDVSILDPNVIEAFKYQGFNPDAVLKSLMKAKKTAKLSNADFLRDVTTLCALAAIKGSVTDKNIKKMTDAGKTRYDSLEKRYNITRGGGKGQPAEVITVARIAAAFPGKIIELLQSGKVPGRDFMGELKTHKLPGVVKHQALAACIPKDLPERSRDFLLDLVTAFSVDQTKTISKTKESLEDLIERQKQFTMVSHNGFYPPEEVRKRIFRGFTWSDILPAITPTATHIKNKWNDFHNVTQQQFMEDLNKMT